ncbi:MULTISPECIES: histidinol-phosphate transaminase [Agrobacterium]|uniref:Histidinol-phosphate aminotransferase n=1 Tax=Agrobacterium tumefaciens TaxID=358 RepID=A0AAJ4MZD4_AGRTU|nr:MULTISPECIES: histidinol-phosphate transaminase [Agrobacterium]MEA1844263.1 histidinol-phosphate transaminase [Agrobacterium tumefaciens]MRH98511.1 histidinol-phosphate transaminase [Agrobacterium tumefaciens]NTA43071.1 histidinol-phosphate transaminase [Agrobacterium tumefaciens]NTA59457.1 histidinol-phosphate transaminase [Agrobacterium tumefaciens]QTG11977.1 histidinol-phosphate transaminase [Agrobacterium tumefaciens]
MADTLRLNPHVAELPPYNAGMNIAVARSKTGLTDIAALASNENPYGCSPKVTAALASLDPSRYADPACVILRDALSRKIGVAGNRIVIGNGSEEMIAAVCRAVLRPDATVVAMLPGFGLHEIEPKANGAKIIKIPMTKDLRFDLEAMTTALREKPSIFFISSPSNPVGPALRLDQLSALIAAVPKETLLVFDEAYFEFCDGNTPDGLKTLADSAISWVVLRTFSKAYGLAGLRVGYAVASDERLAQAMSSAKTPFNVNAAAQLAAVAALDDENWMRVSVESVIKERRRMAAAIASLDLFVPDSQTNFLFIDVGCDSSIAFDHFLSHGVIVKPWKEPEFASFIRVTVGLPAENDRFLEALRSLKDKLPEAKVAS